jgi:hypothetical protein
MIWLTCGGDACTDLHLPAKVAALPDRDPLANIKGFVVGAGVTMILHAGIGIISYALCAGVDLSEAACS